MAVVFPNNWTDGDTLEVEEIVDNDELMRLFVNQDIRSSDLKDNTLGVDSVQVGEYRPVTKDHQFMTGDVVSTHVDMDVSNRSYYTSHTKPTNQTDQNFKIWHPVYEAGQQIVLEQSAKVIVNFGGYFRSLQNDFITSEHRHLSVAYLRLNSGSGWTEVAASKSKVYEESYNYTGTTTIANFPSSIPDNIVNSSSFPIYDADDKVETMFRRWVGFNVLLDLPAGTHQLGVFVNPCVERGYASARNFTVEVFYV